MYQTQELSNLVNGVDQESIEYARYWHGYLVFLRPFLLLFDYSTMQILSAIIFGILTVIMCYLIYRKINIFVAIAFIMSLFTADVFTAGVSLNAITPFYIAVIASIVLLWRFNKIKDKFMIFFIIGSVTAYLDLLTTPLVTLGIPITLYFLLSQKQQEMSTKEIIIKLIKISLAWGLGYALTTTIKWFIVDVLYGREVVINSIQEFFYRTGNTLEESKFVMIGATLIKNFNLMGKSTLYIMLISISILLVLLTKFQTKEARKTKLWIYGIIALMPLLWYTVLLNHSVVHAFFTYRNIILIIINIQVLVILYVQNLIAKKGE